MSVITTVFLVISVLTNTIYKKRKKAENSTDDDKRKLKKAKTLAIAVMVLLLLSAGAETGLFVYINLFTDGAYGELLEEHPKIGFTDENGNKVYFDRDGKSYQKQIDVPYYSKDGMKYEYIIFGDCLKAEDGSELDIYNTYVDSDGYIIDRGEITFSEEETVEFLNKYFAEVSEGSNIVPNFNGMQKDKDGNSYYSVPAASWNKDGKLITDSSDLK